MRPDDRAPRRARPARSDRSPAAFDLVSDPDHDQLAALRAELADAGARIRAERMKVGRDRPHPGFTTRLRMQLVDGYAPPPTLVGRTEPAAPTRPRTPAGPTAPWAPFIGWRASASPLGRWAVLAAAAALVVAVVGLGAGQIATPPTVAAHVGETVAATLLRDGATSTLTAGTALRANDEIRVGPGGRATLELGASVARLDAGTVVRLDDLTITRLRLDLLAGRSYHRVSLPAGGTYTVATGPLTWTAAGTAFDLSREPGTDGQDRIELLALEHTVALAGPDIETRVSEGRAATVAVIGAAASDVHVGPIGAAALGDPWLAANARQDRSLGFPLGVLDGVAGDPAPTGAAPLDTPEARPTDEPTATPGPTDGPDASTSPEPTDRTTTTQTHEQRPDPTPSPKPTPAPQPTLGLRASSCDGGVVVDWTRYRGPRFDRYVTVRSAGGSIAAAYPPHTGATVLEGATSVDRWRTSANDPIGDLGGSFSYRTMALGGDDSVLAASPVRSATARAVGDLGALTIGPGDGSTTAFHWTRYTGPADCFSAVKIAWSVDDPTPSVLDGAGVVFFSGDRGLSTAIVTLVPGTYHFRVEVLRATDLGSPPRFLVAHSDVATYTVP